MCFDCGFGMCLETMNSSICVCNAPYSQSAELFIFQNVSCGAENFLQCLPCNTRNDILFGVYLAIVISHFLILLRLFTAFRHVRQLKRNMFLLSSVVWYVLMFVYHPGDLDYYLVV